MHAFRGLIHFQSLFDFSAMNNGTRKSCSVVCQAKNADYCSGETISGTMQVTFFSMKAIDTVDEQTADLYACYLQAPSQVSSDEAPMLVKKL